MRLKVLGSSSKGNCYLLISDSGKVLIIESGVGLLEVKKALEFNISDIACCLISHSHGDHSKYTSNYIKAGIKCITGKETADLLNIGYGKITIAEPQKMIVRDEFAIMPFPVVHNVPAFGFLILHRESGFICFLTDTNYSHFTFPKISNWLIEANYDKEILEKNIISVHLNAIALKTTAQNHMSIDTCIKTLHANDITNTNKIVLIHLSDGNSNAEQFKIKVIEATGKNVFIADVGLDIEFNEKDF